MKTLLTVLAALSLSFSSIAQTQGVSLRSTNGVAFQRLTVQSHVHATNSASTNTFAGQFRQGDGVTTANGAVAFGLGTRSLNSYAFSTGINNTNGGSGASVSGQRNTITGSAGSSLVGGEGNYALNRNVFVMGDNNIVDGLGSAAFGSQHNFDTFTDYSFAFGRSVNLSESVSNVVAINLDPSADFNIASRSNSFLVNAPGGSAFSGAPVTSTAGFVGPVTTTGSSSTFVGSFTGNGAGLTNQSIVTSNTIVSSMFTTNNKSLVLQHDPTIRGTIGTNDGNVGGFTFGLLYQHVQWTQGPTNDPHYIDDNWSLGLNLGTNSGGYGRANTNFPALGLMWESKFWNGSYMGMEFHLQAVESNGVTPARLMSFNYPWGGGEAGATFAVDDFIVNSFDGGNLLNLSAADNTFDINGVKLRFISNNVPAIQQMNNAGSPVSILYLDAGNVINLPGPVYAVGARAGAGSPIPGQFFVIQPTTFSSGDSMLFLQGNVVAGTHNGVIARSVASSSFDQEFNNQGAGNSKIKINVEGAGDPKLAFDVNGGGHFEMGIDNSDSDKFKISASAVLGTGDIVQIDSSSNVWFAADVSALTFTDRSRSPSSLKEAQEIVASLQTKEGHVDHSKLHRSAWGTKTKVVTNTAPRFVNGIRKTEAVLGTVVEPDSTKRDLGMVVSAQALVIQDLLKRIEALEKR